MTNQGLTSLVSVSFTIVITMMSNVLTMSIGVTMSEIETQCDSTSFSVVIAKVVLLLVVTIMVSWVASVVMTARMAIISRSVMTLRTSISAKRWVWADMTNMLTMSLSIFESMSNWCVTSVTSVTAVMTTVAVTTVAVTTVTVAIAHSSLLTC